mmetsp:Transcript_6976/g.20214  ORF Transcript_6976/g.20214 Transcript_6976/m.20214 type:complete len:209 (-) Transcript_6976:81-707(-)
MGVLRDAPPADEGAGPLSRRALRLSGACSMDDEREGGRAADECWWSRADRTIRWSSPPSRSSFGRPLLKRSVSRFLAVPIVSLASKAGPCTRMSGFDPSLQGSTPLKSLCEDGLYFCMLSSSMSSSVLSKMRPTTRRNGRFLDVDPSRKIPQSFFSHRYSADEMSSKGWKPWCRRERYTHSGFNRSCRSASSCWTSRPARLPFISNTL